MKNSRVPDALVDFHTDENGNGKVNYSEFSKWAQDRLADVAVDDINYTTRSNVDSVSIQAKAAAKIMA